VAIADVRLTKPLALCTLVPAPTIVAVEVSEAVASTTVIALDVLDAVGVIEALPPLVANANAVTVLVALAVILPR